MIYFLQRADGDIKIGTTKNFPDRKRQLVAAHGELILLNLIDGDRSRESLIHDRFHHLRKGNSEWFSDAPELRAFIQSPEEIAVERKHADRFSPRLIVNVNPMLRQQLEECAQEHNVPTSTVISFAIEWYLIELKKQKQQQQPGH